LLILAYETIKTGWTLTIEPKDSSNFLLSIIVLVFAFFIDGFILFKTMREIAKEAEIDNQGNLLLDAFKHAKRAKPATKLVFYEDIVADRKSTRLNSSHVSISYAVFCLKKKKTDKNDK